MWVLRGGNFSMSTKPHGGDKRGGFVPLGDVAGAVDLPGGLAVTSAAPHAGSLLHDDVTATLSND